MSAGKEVTPAPEPRRWDVGTGGPASCLGLVPGREVLCLPEMPKRLPGVPSPRLPSVPPQCPASGHHAGAAGIGTYIPF